RGWWLPLRDAALRRLAEAWEERPRGVTWLGTASARALFRAPHVRARVSVRAAGVDWLAVSAEWEAEGRRLTSADVAQLRASREPYVKLASGWVRRAGGDALDREEDALAELGIAPGEGERRLTLWELAQAPADALAALDALGGEPESLARVRALRARAAAFAGLPRVGPVPGLRAELRPYQQEGLDFLAWTASLGLGAVLADDMGLGKTVQALAWLAHLRAQAPGAGPALVVCPASVMHHWVREAARFTPAARVLLFARGEARRALREAVPRHDLVITNYALLRRDAEFWRDTPLRAAILDEAQQIKNPAAAVTRAALSLRAPHRLALTGTPLENRALDLWSLVSFTNPGWLGSRQEFARRFDAPDAPPRGRRLLSARLKPILLRRLKQRVAAELPPRIEERRDCPLLPGQRRLYVDELRRGRALLGTLAADADGLRRHRFTILATLTRLRQICCHPALAGGRPGLGSGKFVALFELLEPLLAEGHKVLLFSQFVECLKRIAPELAARDIPYHLLTGATTRRDRVVDAFRADPRPAVFLLSLKAGGLGLDLTAASYVVLFDPWWNPAVEAQAIDRTHRIGQTRTVIAYRMLAAGTLEERIWELQQRKAALTREILPEEGFARTLTREDLTWLLAPDALEAEPARGSE
ncbi:MAG TPA: DEAD/DEAH box helicase, partial [Candidatus Eisenbacteria bacterium]|nr:DEAD/DEAH box helicase [Candidatus Eisenbacteria bacterium]